MSLASRQRFRRPDSSFTIDLPAEFKRTLWFIAGLLSAGVLGALWIAVSTRSMWLIDSRNFVGRLGTVEKTTVRAEDRIIALEERVRELERTQDARPMDP